ncbi:MAG TPA: Npt1/Npt2 family nucleotide transporter, partial [Terriglobia bacterium]|nr:Npt1/Npt2 family nucleotide transporter [Terriglobia bacterium]
LSKLRREIFDIRLGEHVRVWAMFGYLFAVLMAYYIVKPVSRAMFLTKFDVDKLPSLYIVIAIAGGVFAYLYSKIASKTSLKTAVFWTMLLSVISLLLMWEFIYFPWMIYVLNIWVSLFSIILVSQGWLVAGNIFNAREAKRLYPLLGMSMVLGAASGGEFTNRVVHLVGTRNLLLACAVIVVLAYAAFRVAAAYSSDGLAQHYAGDESQEDSGFSFSGMLRDLARVRHLQVIIGLMVAMYVVDTLVEYQLQYVAGQAYRGDKLTAFFGQFYGLYLNGIEAIFQLFLTAAVVRRFGVGYTLQISPVTVGLSSLATVFAPGVVSGSIVRLTEASTRYTLNRTGMELLYMPLPKELRNRVKAFIDIAVDRLSRGLGGVLLLVLTGSVFHLKIRGLSFIVMGFCVVWAIFAWMARNEYVASVRRRLETRRVDLHLERITVTDAHTIALLENTATGDNSRQAVYALATLSEAPGYDLRPLLKSLARSHTHEVQDKVYELAAALKFDGLLDQALAQIDEAVQAETQNVEAAPHAVVAYALSISDRRNVLAAELLNSRTPAIVYGALDGIRNSTGLAKQLISTEWLAGLAESSDWRYRTLAAKAIEVAGGEDTEILHRLFEDQHPEPAKAACRAAAAIQSRWYVSDLIRALGRPEVRGTAIASLAAYGPVICGSLADVLLDEAIAPIRLRLQIPRVLKSIPHQRSVDTLMSALEQKNLMVRNAVLRALNSLRETSPELHFDYRGLTEHFLSEAHHYFQLNAALETLRSPGAQPKTAKNLLMRSVEAYLGESLGRLFRLLGLRYPPTQIRATYRALSRPGTEEAAAALEFLDSTLEPDIKRILLPLLDAPEYALDRGRELFGVQPMSLEDSLRILIGSGDPWLRLCALAATAELKLQTLSREVTEATADADERISEIARFAEAALSLV